MHHKLLLKRGVVRVHETFVGTEDKHEEANKHLLRMMISENDPNVKTAILFGKDASITQGENENTVENPNGDKESMRQSDGNTQEAASESEEDSI